MTDVKEEVVIIKGTHNLTSKDRIMGFHEEDGGRFPGTKAGFPPFKFNNGTYRHGVPMGKDRDFIEKELLNGESLDSPKGCEFLSMFDVTLDSQINFFNKADPASLLRFYIAQGDVAEVASSPEDLRSKTMSPRAFVIEGVGESAKEKFNNSRKRNIARAQLESIYGATPTYLTALAKFAAPNTAGIKDSETAYAYLDKLLQGDYTDGSEAQGISRFMNLLDVDKGKIMIAADVKDAIFKNIIRRKGTNYFLIAANLDLGTTEDAVINFLSKDENQEVLGLGEADDKEYSIRYLLNQKKR